jgi:hypothetical protein
VSEAPVELPTGYDALHVAFTIDGSIDNFDSSRFSNRLAVLLAVPVSEIELSISTPPVARNMRRAAVNSARQAARAAALLPDGVPADVRDALLSAQQAALTAVSLADAERAGAGVRVTVSTAVPRDGSQSHASVKLAESQQVERALGVRLLQPVDVRLATATQPAAKSPLRRATDSCAVKLSHRARELRFTSEQLSIAVSMCRHAIAELNSGADAI